MLENTIKECLGDFFASISKNQITEALDKLHIEKPRIKDLPDIKHYLILKYLNE